MLVATEQLPGERLGQFAIAGELALDGTVRPVRGALAMAMSAMAMIQPGPPRRQVVVVS